MSLLFRNYIFVLYKYNLVKTKYCKSNNNLFIVLYSNIRRVASLCLHSPKAKPISLENQHRNTSPNTPQFETNMKSTFSSLLSSNIKTHLKWLSVRLVESAWYQSSPISATAHTHTHTTTRSMSRSLYEAIHFILLQTHGVSALKYPAPK